MMELILKEVYISGNSGRQTFELGLEGRKYFVRAWVGT